MFGAKKDFWPGVWLRQSRNTIFTENFLITLAAVLVGLASGIGVWAFKALFNLLKKFLFVTVAGWMSGIGDWTVILIPVAGGLVVGLIVHFIIGEERYHGVAGIMESVALAGGRLRFWRVPSKILASIISIGSGASVGPEDPSVQIGANIGSMFGQWWQLSNERVRTLVAAGAASGIAAAFNAPIAGIFFALEVIMGEFSGGTVGMVVLASVTSAVVTQAVSGASPAFSIPGYGFDSPIELPFYLILGLLTGCLSAAYIYFLDKAKVIYSGIKIPRWAKTVLAGLIVGCIGFLLPQALGVGYESIEMVLGNSTTTIGLLLLIMLAKLVLTPVSVQGGFQGGVFAPSLVMGSMLGGAYGMVVTKLFPSFIFARPSFAMVGMAAVLAGAVRAPLTAILLLFEMTNDYRIILPLMLTVVVSVWVSSRFEPESVYTLPLSRRGIRLHAGRNVEVLESITVGEVMEKDFPVLKQNDDLQSAIDHFWSSHLHGLPVIDDNDELQGILTLRDTENIQSQDSDRTITVKGLCTSALVTATPDETIGSALRRMAARDIGQLPVVEYPGSRKMVGLLTRADLAKAYEAALARLASARYRAQRLKISANTNVEIEEMRVEPDSACANREMRAIQWPSDCLIASILRGARMIVPRGETVVQPGDILLTVAAESGRNQARVLCKSRNNTPQPAV